MGTKLGEVVCSLAFFPKLRLLALPSQARNCLQKLREDISSKLDRDPGDCLHGQEIQVIGNGQWKRLCRVVPFASRGGRFGIAILRERCKYRQYWLLRALTTLVVLSSRWALAFTHISLYRSIPVPKTLCKNGIHVNKTTMKLLAKPLFCEDSVISLFATQCLIKQTITYKCKLLISPSY